MQRRGGYGGDGGGTAGASTRNSTSSKPGSGDGDGNDPKRVVTFVWHSASHAYTRKLHGSNNPGLLCRQPAYSTEHAVKHGLAIKLPPSQIASRPIIASDTQQPVQHMGVCAHSGDGFQRYIFIQAPIQCSRDDLSLSLPYVLPDDRRRARQHARLPVTVARRALQRPTRATSCRAPAVSCPMTPTSSGCARDAQPPTSAKFLTRASLSRARRTSSASSCSTYRTRATRHPF